MKKYSLILLFIVHTVFYAFALGEPRVAVVPFNAIGVSERDAQVLSGLFETALVKTESFSVIEQNQVNEIVEAQAYSMSGCTDEACAIEFGELLSAEQIILGDVSMIGGKYIINAKIIDVAKGRNIKADNVEAESMAEMTSATELLAYKLAGLTFSSGENVMIARDFGEVIIETEPSGADIFINGVKKGVSPDLINRIPIGNIRIEARKDGLYAIEDVTVSAETGVLSLILEEMYGNIFVKSSVNDANVYLDGVRIGPLGNGFIKDIEIGTHRLEIRSSDRLWKGEVEVENGVSTRIDVYPQPFGVIQYDLPDGVHARANSNDQQYLFTGEGSINVLSAIYNVTLTGGIYERYQSELEITQGQRLLFNPNLKTVKALEKEFLQNIFDQQRQELDHRSDSSHQLKKIIDSIESLQTKIEKSEHDFPLLLTKTEDLHNEALMELRIAQNQEDIESMKQDKINLERDLEIKKQVYSSSDILGVVYTLCGIGFSAIAIDYNGFLGLFIEDRMPADDDLLINIFFGIIGVAGLTFGIMEFIPDEGDNRAELRKSIRQLDKKIEDAKLNSL